MSEFASPCWVDRKFVRCLSLCEEKVGRTAVQKMKNTNQVDDRVTDDTLVFVATDVRPNGSVCGLNTLSGSDVACMIIRVLGVCELM